MNILIEPLGQQHDRGAFCCGNDLIDSFCRDALYEHEAYKHRIYVATYEGRNTVLGYYCLRLITFGKKNYARPEIELAMIGVHKDFQNLGIGTALLTHAFQRAYDVAQAVGVSSIWLDATNEDSARLYERLGFNRAEPGKLKMFIPLKDIIDAIENPIS